MATNVVKDLCRQDVTLPTKVGHGAKYLLDYPIYPDRDSNIFEEQVVGNLQQNGDFVPGY
jgi:hypothetical protein